MALQAIQKGLSPVRGHGQEQAAVGLGVAQQVHQHRIEARGHLEGFSQKLRLAKLPAGTSPMAAYSRAAASSGT